MVNDQEARQLAGESNLVRAGRRLLEFGPRTVVVKKGEHGAAMFSTDGEFAMPALHLDEVRDPTGAGDSFAGGLLGFLAWCGDTSGVALRRAVAYGSVLASFTVEDFGVARLRTVRPEEIAARLEELRVLTHLEPGGWIPAPGA